MKIFFCRLCAVIESTNTYFNLESNEQIYEDIKIKLNVLNIACNIYNHETYSNTVCITCYDSLNSACEFKNKVLAAQCDISKFLENVPDPINTDNKEIVEIKVNDLNITPRNSIASATTEIVEIKEQCVKITPWHSPDISASSEIIKINEQVLNDPPPYNYNVPVPEDIVDRSKEVQCTNKEQIIKTNDEDIKIKQYNTNSWYNYLWSCSHCTEIYGDVSQLRKHSIEAHGLCNAFKCSDCLETFDSYQKLTHHVRNHRRVLRFFCIYCNVMKISIPQCMSHEKKHKKTSKICLKCGEIYCNNNPIPLLCQHNFDSTPNAKKAVKKSRCNSGDRTSDAEEDKVVKKSRRYSDDSLSSFCPDEDLSVGHPIPPKEIQTDSWDDYPWICRICDKAFNNVDILRSHLQIIHKKCAALKCLDCMHNFGESSFDVFLQHVANHRRSLCNICFYCHQEFPTIEQLHIHKRKIHFNVTLYCKKCGVTFKNKQERQEHLPYMNPKKTPKKKKESTAVKNQTCNICDKAFYTLSKLKYHTERVHLNIRNYTCDQCGSSFYLKAQLEGHISVEHNKKTFKCELCVKSFKSLSNLRLHLRYHSTEKPYSCNVCSKGFKVKQLLNNHITIHSNVKPFKCRQCDKSFRLLRFLKKHEIIHTGLKPFSCKICNASYANRENCYNHMKKKHDYQRGNTNMEVELDEVAQKWKEEVLTLKACKNHK